ncbi:MAG: Ni/Fe hydrogenase subunit alpha [Phycisphaerae bacterium]
MSASVKQLDTRTIRVNALARVEGEGALHLELRDGQVTAARLEIYEPPRFYEAFLRGRDFREVPDLTARICGICPVAYQMSSCHALEKAVGVTSQVDPGIRALRDLLYCGEWIESHVLHMFLLHLPDFLGYESAISMAADHGPVVQKALALKKLGNEILAALGGRAVHPVNVCVGGFYSLPDAQRLAGMVPEIRKRLDEMCELTLFLAEKVEYPAMECDYEFVAMQPDDEYPMNRGPIASSKGFKVPQEELLDVIEERHVPHSNALHAVVKERGNYHVGPLARLNLNAERLHPRAAQLLPKLCAAVGQPLPWRNSFLSLLARGLETVHALALALDILRNYVPPARSRVPVIPRTSVGAAATEAPRGTLWHRYEMDAAGLITAARIIPPTSQNQARIEEDLMQLASASLHMSDEELCHRCEHLIRNYDPCISCSAHFLKLHVDRKG